VIMQAMPDDVIKIDNGIMRFEGPGRYARNVDLDAEPITFCRNITACDRTRFSPGQLRRVEGSYPRRLSRQLGEMVQLLTRMYKAGVPIVSGTDGSGIEIIRELEVYHEAGLTNAEALAAATITPARLLNVDKKTGSIEVGKAANHVLVEGDPSERLSDLRQTRVVMLDGKLMDATRCAVPQDSPAGRSRLVIGSW